ncbi:MAG: D-amino-acid transaminase [Pseudomonadota bacterium]
MAKYIYLNGQYLAHNHAMVHVEDRAFLFGDAVYEVIACIHGHFVDERAHLDRLERSCAELKMDMPVERETLRVLMRELLRKNKIQNSAIYIQVTRGRAKRDFKFPSPETRPTLMMMTPAFDFDNNQGVLKGISVKTLPDIRWKRRDVKSILLLPQSLAKQAAVEAGCGDAWMVDDEGYVTEGSASNAYIVKGKEIITRPVTTSILKGTTRNALENLCGDLGYKFTERKFTPKKAYDADEAFVTGATTLVTPVLEIDGNKIGTGKIGEISKGLLREYLAYVEGLRQEQVKWESGL